jgi:hypothetical protein
MESFQSVDIAALFAAAILGSMLFFAAVVAPLVFAHFPEADAGAFIRRLFPRYYDVLAVVTALGSLFALGSAVGALMSAVMVLFVFSRFWLMPRINDARDAGRAARFALLHRASVIINLAQMAALIGVLMLALN